MAMHIRGLGFEIDGTLVIDNDDLQGLGKGDQDPHYQQESELGEEDSMDMEMRLARNMLYGDTHHGDLINQNRVLIALKRELGHTDPRKREIYELIGQINAKLAQSKLDAANSLINRIRSLFEIIGRALRNKELQYVDQMLYSNELHSLRRQLFEAPPWLVNAIEEATGETYSTALANFNEVLAAAKDSLVRLEDEKKAAEVENLRKVVELQRQKVRDVGLERMDPNLVKECKAEISRIKASIETGNVDAAISMLVPYRINIQRRDTILAIEGQNPEEFFREIDAAITQKRREKTRA